MTVVMLNLYKILKKLYFEQSLVFHFVEIKSLPWKFKKLLILILIVGWLTFFVCLRSLTYTSMCIALHPVWSIAVSCNFYNCKVVYRKNRHCVRSCVSPAMTYIFSVIKSLFQFMSLGYIDANHILM